MRFSLGDRPVSQALRAWTMNRSQPAAATVRTKRVQVLVAVRLVDADAVLDGDRQLDRLAHRRDALGRPRSGSRHQARAEARLLHARRGQPTLRLTSS